MSNGPAYTSLVFSVNSLQMQGGVEQPQANLFLLIKHDLSYRNWNIFLKYDLSYFRNIAFE